MNEATPAADGPPDDPSDVVGALAARLARRVGWPSSPLRRIRLVLTTGVVGVLGIFGLVLLGAPAVGPARFVAGTGIFAVLAVMVRQYRDGAVTWSGQALMLVLLALVTLTDGAFGVGQLLGQMTMFTVALYVSGRRCILHAVIVQAVFTASVIAKLKLDVNPGIRLWESWTMSLALFLLGGVAFTVTAVVGRYERTVGRERIVLRACTDLVAAETSEGIRDAVLRAVGALAAPGERADVTPTPTYPPHRAADGLARYVMPLGSDDDGRPVELVVTGSPRLSGSTLSGLRALEPTVELALRGRELTKGLRRQAFHDPLTGLANRASFTDRLACAVDHADAAPVALMLVDLDGFKAVNDSLGHAAGDELLIATARRLTACVREGDVVARLGGDEFVVLLQGQDAPQRALLTAEQILKYLSVPTVTGNTEVLVRASVGVAMSEPPGVTGDELLANADLAMYEAKSRGKGCYQVHHPGLRANALDRLTLAADLQHALDRQEFTLEYQPLRVLGTGRDGVGDPRAAGPPVVEARLCWQHPTRGLLKAEEFLGLAEQTGLIVPIRQWMLRQACRDAQGWPPADGGDLLSVYVALSAVQVPDPALPGHVRGALEGSRLAPHRLVVAIAEPVVLGEEAAAVRRLAELKELGVQVALYGFGSGYSSIDGLLRSVVDLVVLDGTVTGGDGAGGGWAGPGQDLGAVETLVGFAGRHGVPAAVPASVPAANHMIRA